MRISRIYTEQALSADTEVQLDEDASHYILRVLRLKPGQELAVFNGRDGEFIAEVSKAGRHQVGVKLGARRPNPFAKTNESDKAGKAGKAKDRKDAASEKAAEGIVEEGKGALADAEDTLQVHLCLGISRGVYMDLALQKATELGVAEISPVFTEYCGVKIAPQRMENKLRHWQRILISAVEQSGRLRVPRLNLPVELMQLPAAATNSVSDSPASTTPTQTTADRGCLALMLEPSAADYLPTTLPDKIQLFIGPEGGFSPDELQWAKAQGVQLANLGTAILRTETAPAATLAILHHIHRTQ